MPDIDAPRLVSLETLGISGSRSIVWAQDFLKPQLHNNAIIKNPGRTRAQGDQTAPNLKGGSVCYP